MLVYKVSTAGEWAAAERSGVFTGSAVDLADGYLHLSAADQVVETVARHFAGRTSLVVLAVDADRLAADGGDLRWEPSRGGALFPHLYGSLPTSAVHAWEPLPDEPAARAAALGRLTGEATPIDG